MQIGRKLFRHAPHARPGRTRRAHRPSTTPAIVESLEGRVLLAATVYQTPIQLDVSTQAALDQGLAKVGVADNGDFVVLWEEVLNAGTAQQQSNVAYRRFSANGTPKDAQQQYIAQSAADESNVALAVAPGGGFVAVWQQLDSDSGTYDIWFSRYFAGSGLLTAPARANVNTAGDQVDPSVAIADDGTFIIAWTDHGTDAAGDIAARRFFASGEHINAAEFYVADTEDLIEENSAVAVNGTNGDFVIVWSQGESTGVPANKDVYFELRSATGSTGTLVAAGQANVTTLADQDTPSVAMADAGNFVIAWETDIPPDGVDAVAYRRFDATGAAVDAADQIITTDPALEQGDPVVSITADGTRFVIAYDVHDATNPDGTAEVWFQVFDNTATLVSGPARAVGVPARDVSVSIDPSGNFVFAYTEIGTTQADNVGATVVSPLTASEIVAAAGPGGGPAVRVFNPLTGQMTRSFFAFDPAFRGGVTVATADLNDDTFPEIIVGVASNGPPLIRVFDGASGKMLSSFLAFPAAFQGGVTIATGDVDGDGDLDLVVGAGTGGGPAVRVFDGLSGTQIGSQFFAFNSNFRGGVNVATGDVNGDGTDEIIVGAGPGGGPVVRVFEFDTLDGVQTGEFLAFPLGFTGGVFVSAGDIDEDGSSEIIVGAGAGGGPVVRMYEADGTQIGNQILAFPLGFRGGVRVATGDVDGDSDTDIIVAAGPGGGPAVRTFDPDTETEIGSTFFAFPTGFQGGVFVAGRALGVAAEGSPLTADPSTPPLAGSGTSLDGSNLPAIVAAAHVRFSLAGLSPELLAALSGVEFIVTDLGGDRLGLARSGRVYLDDDAAGRGWFVDYSPLLDEEFFGQGPTLTAADGSAAADRIDLLSVVLHELGHVLGFDHGSSFMDDTLASGTRRLPTADDLDALFAGNDVLVS